jgi:hypothetical protein
MGSTAGFRLASGSEDGKTSQTMTVLSRLAEINAFSDGEKDKLRTSETCDSSEATDDDDEDMEGSARMGSTAGFRLASGSEDGKMRVDPIHAFCHLHCLMLGGILQ